MQETIKIINIGEIEIYGASNFEKRIIKAETVAQFPQILNFEFHSDNVDIPKNYAIGEQAVIDFNIKGREHTKEGKTNVYMNLVAWRLTRK